MNNKGATGTIVAIVIIVIVLIGIVFWAGKPAKRNTATPMPSQEQSVAADNPSGQTATNQDMANTNSPAVQNNNASTPSPEKAQISIKNFAFSPGTLTVKSGTTVVWTNQDSTAHTVAAANFNSGNINPGGTFQFTFASPGTYTYHCSIHPSMTGTIIVQ